MRLTSLKLCRFEHGVMQNVLARRADIAWGRLSAIENGDAEAQPDELQRIAAALQVPLDALLAGRSGQLVRRLVGMSERGRRTRRPVPLRSVA